MTKNIEDPIDILKWKESKKRRNKLFQSIKSNTKNVRYDDLIKLLTMSGFESSNPKKSGSHNVYTSGDCTITVPKPHGNNKFVKRVYVQQAIKYIEELIESEAYEK